MSKNPCNLSVYTWRVSSSKAILLQNHWANFNQTWHKASLSNGDSSLFKWRTLPFSREDNYKIVKIHWRNLKLFFSRRTGPISTKLGTKHPWMKGIQVCSNERPCPFLKGNNYEIAKIHWRNLKIFFSRTTKPISTKLGTKHPWVKGIQVCSNEGPAFFQGEMITK